MTAGTIVGLIATGHTEGEILELYPYLEKAALAAALSYAAWRVEEIDLPLVLA